MDRPTSVQRPGPGSGRGFAGGKGSGIGSRGSGIGSKKGLPVAKPLDDSSASEFVIDTDQSPAVAQVRARSPLGEKQIESFQTRRKRTPLWLWTTIAAGVVIVLILMIALFSGQ